MCSLRLSLHRLEAIRRSISHMWNMMIIINYRDNSLSFHIYQLIQLTAGTFTACLDNVLPWWRFLEKAKQDIGKNRGCHNINMFINIFLIAIVYKTILNGHLPSRYISCRMAGYVHLGKDGNGGRRTLLCD